MSNNRFEELAAKGMGLSIADEPTKEEAPKQEVPKEEPTKEEPTKEDSSLNDEETPKGEPTQDDDAPKETPQEVSFESLLDEKSGGKYKTYEELEEALTTESSSVEFANEQIAKLNDYVAKGGNVNEYLRTQTANYDDMSEQDIVKSFMRFNNPDLDGSEIELLFSDKYKLDEDEYTEDEIRLSNIKLKQASNKARAELKKFQSDNSTPEVQRDLEAEQAKIEENQKVWRGKVDNNMKEFKNVEFDINDKGEKFSFELSDKAVDNVSNSTKNLPAFWDRYVNKDGSENITKLVKDMAILDNVDSIVRSAYAQGAANGKEDVIEDIKNPSYTPENRGDSDKPLSIEAQIEAEFRKNM